jgi:SAM-dependent methyltransferase
MSDQSADKPFQEANRRSWNAATVAHNSHKRDQAGFLRRGGSTLFPEELDLLGDIRGRHVAHLQCNAGQDTLCLARLGAHVVGVDISDDAIRFARALSSESGIRASFHREDVFAWLNAARGRNERFDVVFCSYGSICWLSDLTRWAEGISGVLVPGGRFVTVDIHPASMMFDEHYDLAYSYFGEGTPIKREEGVGDYVAMSGSALAPSGFREGVRDFQNPYPVYEFQWHLGAILTSLLTAGLSIERFDEYPFFNGAALFEGMCEEPGRRMVPPTGRPVIPLMFGLVAKKQVA